ncbi:MAG TPA: RNA polymerase sigma-54 factor, partial [Bacteroidetes bacterium]|nr:RNA polymerase sigma-54 factor [Bacteroidota bacterium]
MLNVTQRMSMQQKQSPQQVLLSTLLQLPILSLEQRIKMELETNPLLEEVQEEELEMEQSEPEMLMEQDSDEKIED